jgi:hypothetical protein
MIGPKRTTTETGGRIHQSRHFSLIRENRREIAIVLEISLIFQIFTPGPPGFFRSSIILPGGPLSKQLLKAAEYLRK